MPQRINRRTWKPYIERLMEDLDVLLPELHRVIDDSGIHRNTINDNAGGVFVVGAARYVWGPETPEVSALLMDLTPRWVSWETAFRALFPHPTHQVARQLDAAMRVPQSWILRKNSAFSHTIPGSLSEAHRFLGETQDRIRAHVTLPRSSPGVLIAIPDTSALLDQPDVAAYATQLGSGEYEVLFIPTVLGELDQMKRAGRTHDIQNSAKAVVRRLKGLRDKGDPQSGVSVTKTIVARFPMNYPKSAKSALPDWLDSDLPDDQILTTALTIQRARPQDTVVVVTSDINMQNKAAALSLPYVEPVPQL